MTYYQKSIGHAGAALRIAGSSIPKNAECLGQDETVVNAAERGVISMVKKSGSFHRALMDSGVFYEIPSVGFFGPGF